METPITPNKYVIFQNFYFRQNGVILTYNEAVRLFHKMDDTTKSEFSEYYADECGYELIGGVDPFVSAQGRANLSIDRDKLNSRGVYSTALTQHDIYAAHTIGARINKYSSNIDPKWLVYSAEEIINMANNGVNVPSEVLDVARSISDGSVSIPIEDNDNPNEENPEKADFLELIPKTEKNIEKCNEKRENIDEKIEDLLGESNRSYRNLFQKQRNYLEELQDYEDDIREWRILQDKINNGEELSDTEASRYAQITGMLEDRNNSEDFKIDKNGIASKLNQINIFALLGKKIAKETIEMGEMLSDYTSNRKYKETQSNISEQIGFLRAISTMIYGKNLAKEAVIVGNETQEYTQSTSHSINNIADILNVESLVTGSLNGASAQNGETPETKTAESDVTAGTNDDASNGIESDETGNNVDAAEKENSTNEEDFLVNDENVIALIDEAEDIHADLGEEIKLAFVSSMVAKGDADYIKSISKFIDKLVAEYQEEEAKRQQIIAEKEKENKEAQDEINQITGEENGNNVDGKTSDKDVDTSNLTDEDRAKVAQKQEIIRSNNAEIENINKESEQSKEQFKAETAPHKKKIADAVPVENENFERDNKYKAETIPYDTTRLDFTESSGGTLYKMGKYRVQVGMELLSKAWFSPSLYREAMHHITRGKESANIGSYAKLIGAIPTDEKANKAVEMSTGMESEALNALNDTDAKISAITGEETAAAQIEAQEDENGENGENNPSNEPEGNNVKSQAAPQPAVESAPADNNNQPRAAASARTNKNQLVNEVKSGDKPQENSGERRVKGRQNTPAEQQIEDVLAEGKAPITANTSTSSKKDEKDMDTDEAESSVSDIKRSAKDSAKDSKHVKEDTEKDEKQLLKETKRLQKQMKKDEKEIIKMTKQSIRAAKKQAEILVEYEELVAENDQIVAEEQQKKVSAPSQANLGAQQEAPQGVNPTQTVANAQPTDSSKSTTSDNAEKLQQNDTRIAVLGSEFDMHGKKITRNRNRILKLQKRTKVNNKKYIKKSKVRNAKIKEAEQKELEKQKKLAKQLGTVGIAENIFTVTQATGAIMMLSVWPATVAAGKILFYIGTAGVILCGLTKAGINLANGNLTGALMGLGQTALTVAAGVTGTGAAMGTVMTAVTNGLTIVASSAELVNNVRAVQGKEANSVFSMISTIAGTASSLTSAAGGLTQLKGASFGKIAAAVGTATGATLSAVSQIMSQFNLGNQELISMLGMVGGAISMASGLASLTMSKKKDADNKNNNDTKEQVKNDNNNNNQQTQKSDNSGNKTDNTQKSDNTQKTDNDSKKPDNNEQKTDNNEQKPNTDENKTQNNSQSENSTDKKADNKSTKKNNNGLNIDTTLNNTNTNQVNSTNAENYIDVVNNSSDNNSAKADNLKVQNNSQAKQEILNTNKEPQKVKPIQPAELKELAAKGISGDIPSLDDPKLQAEMKTIADKVKSQQQEQLNQQQAKEQRKENWNKGLETTGNVLNSVAGILEMFSSDGSGESQAVTGVASNGKQYLGKPYQNAKSFRESREQDYRKKAKKMVKRVASANSSRNVR